jgi:hypothetical protein
LLESVVLKLGLGWLDVVKFEACVMEALEIQDLGVEKMENSEINDEFVQEPFGTNKIDKVEHHCS